MPPFVLPFCPLSRRSRIGPCSNRKGHRCKRVHPALRCLRFFQWFCVESTVRLEPLDGFLEVIIILVLLYQRRQGREWTSQCSESQWAVGIGIGIGICKARLRQGLPQRRMRCRPGSAAFLRPMLEVGLYICRFALPPLEGPGLNRSHPVCHPLSFYHGCHSYRDRMRQLLHLYCDFSSKQDVHGSSLPEAGLLAHQSSSDRQAV